MMQVPLTPELELIWQQMTALRQHARYPQALAQLDEATRQRCSTLLSIPRIWLADGRRAQVSEAISIIEAALADLPPPRASETTIVSLAYLFVILNS